MPLKISELKSAEIVEAPGKIADLLRKRSSENTLRIEEGTDGQIEVFKSGGRSSGPIEVKAALPAKEEIRRLAESVGLVWRDEYAERVVPYVASDERVDRHGDIVRQVWDFTEFSVNPILLFAHNWAGMPIGNAIRWQVVNRTGPSYTGPALELLDLFVTEEESAEADSVFRLISSGVMRSSSVGFYPKRLIVVSDEKERAELGLGRWGVIFAESILVEHSPVAVPANVGATVISNFAKSASVRDRDVDVIRESMRIDAITQGISGATWNRLDGMVRSIWRSRFADYRTEPAKIDNPIEPLEPSEKSTPKGKPTSEVKVSEEKEPTLSEVLGEIRAMRQDLDALAETVESVVRDRSDEGTEEESSDANSRSPNDALSQILESATTRVEAHTKSVRGN